MQHPTAHRAIIFDADGTLRRCTVDGQPCPNKPDEWALMPHVAEVLALYKPWFGLPEDPETKQQLQRGWGIVSNQGGIAIGHLSKTTTVALLSACAVDAGLAATPYMNYWWRRHLFFCPHAPNAGCICRKPSPYLLLHAARQWCNSEGICKASDVLYVGDQESDMEAATRAGIDFCFAQEFFQACHGMT